MRRYLVVANRTLGGDDLVQAVRDKLLQGPSEFFIVVPATHPSHLADMGYAGIHPERMADGGSTLAQQQLDVGLQRLHEAGATADGEVGDAAPMNAIRDVLAHRDFDEIILSTLPQKRSRWLRQDLPSKIQQTFRLPLTHIVSGYPHW
jgi:hypothetical protein